MKVSSAFMQGNFNKNRGKECQDYTSYYVDEHIIIAAVADGASASRTGRTAAEVNVKEAIKYLNTNEAWANVGDREVFLTSFSRKLRDAFVETTCDLAELCATLTVAAIKTDGSYLVLSIGDGTVVSYDDWLYPSIFTKPFNVDGIQNRTCFTNNLRGCIASAEIRTGNINEEGISGFALITDGADFLTNSLYLGGLRFRAAAGSVAIGCGDQYIQGLVQEITRDLDVSDDDVGIAIVMKDSDDIVAIAHEVYADPTYCFSEAQEEESTVVLPMEGIAPMHQPIVNALLDAPLTERDLVEGGYCLSGHVLETMFPLISDGIVVRRNQAYQLSEKMLGK